MRTMFFLSLLAAGMQVKACFCSGPPTDCESLAIAKVAFVGTVRQGTDLENGSATRFGTRNAVISVETIVRGLPEGVREIHVNPSVGTSCHFGLKAGERWLIIGGIGDADPNVVQTAVCSGSQQIRPGDIESIAKVSSYLEGPSLFLGSVRFYKGWDSRWREDNLMAGAKVTLKGHPKEWSMTTGEAGTFEARGLSAGEYPLTVSKPGLGAEMEPGRISNEGETSIKIVIPERGCVEAHILLRPDTAISGSVQDIDGNPLPGVKVTAFEQKPGENRSSVRTVTSGEGGRYEITGLSAGRYIIGVNAESGVDPEYPATFYPTAPSEFGALQVALADGKHVGDINILVPLKRKSVTVRVRVIWPDESPVANAMITADHPVNGRIYFSHQKPTEGLTGSNGFASIELREGTEYALSARWEKTEPSSGNDIGRTVAWHHSNPVKMIAGQGVDVTLILREQPE